MKSGFAFCDYEVNKNYSQSFCRLWWKLLTLPAFPNGLFCFMVSFRIDIEAVADDPKALNILLKAERNQAAEAEDTAAKRLLPALRDLLKRRLSEGEESQ